ncbi:hypothetical protein [Alteromonas genovensis]|uniref:hypothetical protein n=1 Tax=Alteromonas genovensis TaxID=471225 RepID=UPI002FE0E906
MASQQHQEIFDLAADLEQTKDSEFNSYKDRQFNVNYAASDNDETETIVNILGGSGRSGQWTVPREINIITIFGGHNIYVPENINVVSKAFCILGGINNKAPSIASRQAPTLTIEGLV